MFAHCASKLLEACRREEVFGFSCYVSSNREWTLVSHGVEWKFEIKCQFTYGKREQMRWDVSISGLESMWTSGAIYINAFDHALWCSAHFPLHMLVLVVISVVKHFQLGMPLPASPTTTLGFSLLIGFCLLSPTYQFRELLEQYFCNPLLPDITEDVRWLPPSTPPCLHEGQPVFELLSNSSFEPPRDFHSDDISLDADAKLAFAKKRICFYNGFWRIKLFYSCPGGAFLQKKILRLKHPIFSKMHRRKRWVRRRNPLAALIHFQQERYITEAREDIPVGSLIMKVRANHVHNESLYYSMSAPEDSRSTNIFTLDTVTGEIRLAKALDREALDKHVLKVTAYERLDLAVSSSTTVIVDVIDVQDNAPVFERSSYYAEVREDAPIGTTVVSVFARDLDSGLNGQVEYSLKENPSSNFLKIGSTSGVIQTARELDRESLDLLRFSVIATDKGDPPMSSDSLVEIAVLDVNDNEPTFEKDFFNVTILENITVPANIFQVKASDPDFGLNGQVHYSIVTASANGFSIDYDSGVITLHEMLDARSSPVTLLIRAKDSGQPAASSTATCTVYIIDINDHHPRFVSLQQQVFVDENVPVGHEITRVYAVDEDSGVNGVVRYSLKMEPADDDPFEINPVSGSIRTRQELDRETKSTYILNVTAEDGGEEPHATTVRIMVRIRDFNDNAPYFEPRLVNLSVAEDTTKGTALFTVKANDKDEDQKVTYRIEHCERNVFSLIDLGEQGALLTLSDNFRKTDDTIEIIISATDSGGLKGTCTIRVVVRDINEAPYFLNHPYSIHIPEDFPVGSEVVQLRAKDSDRGDNARLLFEIDNNDFKIDESTGRITVARALDREEKSSYVLTVKLQDHGQPPLSSTTTIEILLDDVNDNAPEFVSQNYTSSIPEDTPVGTSFLQVEAVDEDSGANGFVDYILSETNDPEQARAFKLDMSSGTLRVDRKLDREEIERYNLEVVARDRGNPPLSSKTTVTIILTDVNDNAPKFELLRYDFWIAENSRTGTTVGTLTATDLDSGKNAEISFKIFGGSDAKLFDIETVPEQNGLVRVFSREMFDYEAKKNLFYFEIQASSEQLSTIVPVYVHVSDVNDNPPQFRDFVALAANYAGEQFDGIIGQVPAFDPDHNATLEYFLEDNGIFVLHNTTGVLRMPNLIERQIDAEYKSCVSDGPNVVCAKAHLIYVFVDESLLRDSVTVQLEEITRDQFLDFQVFHRFLSAISLLDYWRLEDIRVFSIQPHDGLVNVTFSVVTKESVQSAAYVKRLIELGQSKLSEISGLRIRVASDDLCSNEPCPYFQECKATNKFFSAAQRARTDNFLLRSIDTLSTFVCECPRGFISTDDRKLCNQRMDLCFSSPCLHSGACVSLETTYRCDCAEGWTGRHCETSIFVDSCFPQACSSGSRCVLSNRTIKCEGCRWRRHDADGQCRLRSLSFNGTGFLGIPRPLSRIEWTVAFSVATVQSAGTLFFAGRPDADFVQVSLSDGLLHIRFSLGGNLSEGSMEDWKENRLNDGEWHRVTVEFFKRKIRYFIDDCEPYIATATSGLSGYPKCAAEITATLEDKCADEAVRCHRFLDISTVLYLGGRSSSSKISHVSAIDGKLGAEYVEDGFAGCIANLTIDGQLVDFSNFEKLEKTAGVIPGCSQKRDYCTENVCHLSATCVHKWNGYNCRCPNAVHSDQECKHGNAPEIQLYDEESYVLWETVDKGQFKNISFEFRTRLREAQILAFEFQQPSLAVIFGIDQGQGLLTVGSDHYIISFPNFSDGVYKSLFFEMNDYSAKIIIDNLYKKQIPLYIGKQRLSVKKIYSGNLPSSSYPQKFEGCIRSVMINGLRTQIAEHSGTKPGCHVSNQCQQRKICPRHSKCVPDWDRHRCECFKGYFGDNCFDVCSIRNICGVDGLCLKSPTTSGYQCLCSNDTVGRNCERKAAVRICPPDWYGRFPHCKECGCEKLKGFSEGCNPKTGQCLCKPEAYRVGNKCVPCECGYGSVDKQCSTTGQCTCAGEAEGRRCDRCRRSSEMLDRRTLKCLPVRNRCPSNIENGIQWPTTINDAVATQSCAYGQFGLATRKCDGSSSWHSVNSYNCTFPSFQKLHDVPATLELAQQLANATNEHCDLHGRNLELVTTFLRRIVNEELGAHHSSNHIAAVDFTKNLVVTMSCVVGSTELQNLTEVLQLIAAYGTHLRHIHLFHRFLEPFLFSTENLVFAIDVLRDSDHHTLPKFNNFMDTRLEIFRFVQLELFCLKLKNVRQVVFYSAVDSRSCHNCAAPIVSVSQDGSQKCSARVSFPIAEEAGWRRLECVYLKLKDGQMRNKGSNKLEVKPSALSSPWGSDGAAIFGLNETHVTCQFETLGTFAVFAYPDSGAIIRFYAPQTIPYTASLSLVFSIFMTLLSAVVTLFRRGIQTRFIRFCIITSLLVNIATLCLLQRVHFTSVFNGARNAVISFCASALFAWFFLYSLHIYFLFVDGVHRVNFNLSLFVGIIAPVVFALVTFFVAPGNFAGFNDRLFWILAMPIVFFLLLTFYSSATSFIISFSKEFDVVVAKFSLRKTLLLHFLLTVLCFLYEVSALLMAFDVTKGVVLEVSSNMLLVFATAFLFIWTVYFGQQRSSQSPSGNWFRGTPKDAVNNDGGQCQTPLLSEKENENYRPSKREEYSAWMPDIIPPSTYARSDSFRLKHQSTFPRSDSLRTSPQAFAGDAAPPRTIPRMNILTPPTNVLLESKYDCIKTKANFSPRHYDTVTSDADCAYQNYSKQTSYPLSTFRR